MKYLLYDIISLRHFSGERWDGGTDTSVLIKRLF
jgi:hypothetical protein